MNAPSGIALVPARLPYLDRRALSEAWYSALRLARASRGEPPRSERTPLAAERVPGRVPAARSSARPAVQAHPPVPARSQRVAGAAAAAPETRAARSSPPRDVRAASRRGRVPAQAYVTLTLEGARVRILARREGARMHVIALCGAAQVATVRRALGLLERTLRARGERLEAAIRTVARCETERAG